MNPVQWRCSTCGRPTPNRIRNCVCPSSRVIDAETGTSAAKVAIPWREELRAAIETAAQRSQP